MVDIVARVVIDGDDRKLVFKSDDVVFGGGRLNLTKTSIPLDWNELMKIYDAQEVVEVETKTEVTKENERETEAVREEVVEPAKRTRKSRVVEELITEDTEEEVKPKRRRRSSEE